jgi:hypothetical protein
MNEYAFEICYELLGIYYELDPIILIAITWNVIVMVNDNNLLESVRRQVEDHSCTKMNYWAVFLVFFLHSE